MEKFPASSPFLKIVILIGMSACKFHKHLLSQLTVTDCLHDDVCCNKVRFMAVTNEQAGIAELIDQTWSSISCIQDGFNRSIFKNGLVTAGTF